MTKYKLDDFIFKSNEVPKPAKISPLYNQRLAVLSESVTNERIYDLNVDFAEYQDNQLNDMIFIKGDMNTSIVKAKMIMKGSPIDLTGVTVSINVKEGNQYETTTSICTDVDITNSIVTVNLSPYAVDEVGTNKLEFVLTKGDKILVSKIYSYRIIQSLGEGEIGDEVEISALQTLIGIVQELQNNMMVEVTSEDIDDVMKMITDI